MKNIIDINCDLGEGIGNEAEIMPFISSCNLACGGHAGDGSTIDQVVALAKHNNVRVGAHPSFPDKANFGRKPMVMSKEDLYVTLRQQILLVMNCCAIHDLKMHHVKPHGALYNLCSVDENLASVVIDVMLNTCPGVALYAPPGSEIARLAKGKIVVLFEGFADRNYNGDLTLVSRQENDALLTRKEDVLDHVLTMVKEQKIRVRSGEKIDANIDTICIHGDTKNAVEIASFLYENLTKKGINIK